MSATEFAILCFGFVQFMLFAFAQQMMLVGASKPKHFVDPTASLFSVGDIQEKNVRGYARVYRDFFRGFGEFSLYLLSQVFRRQARPRPHLPEQSAPPDHSIIPSTDEFEEKTLKRLQFLIYSLNLSALLVLSTGVIFGLLQSGPESYIRPIDLFLILSFNVFTIACLIFTYEARVRILRIRFTTIIGKLVKRQEKSIDSVDFEQILKRTSEIIGSVTDSATTQSTLAPDRIASGAEHVLPATVEDFVRELVSDPQKAKQLMVDNGIFLENEHKNRAA